MNCPKIMKIKYSQNRILFYDQKKRRSSGKLIYSDFEYSRYNLSVRQVISVTIIIIIIIVKWKETRTGNSLHFGRLD